MYIEISEMFKNHITVIEKNDITIHIDIELLSSPTADPDRSTKKLVGTM